MKKIVLLLITLIVLIITIQPYGFLYTNAKSVLTININDISAPNPFIIEEPSNFWIASLIWQTLTWHENGKVYPIIAESWTASGTTWKFKIRDHIFWKDGKKLTATDVVHTYQTLLNMPIYQRQGATIWLLISNIKAVQTASNNTVIFKLFKPDKNFARDVTSNIFIFPTYSKDKIPTYGSGMYFIKSMDSNQITLEKNPFYKGHIPYGDHIIFTTNKNTGNLITYPSSIGFQQYNLSIRLVFNTTATPFKTWPYRYLLISTIPYDNFSTTGTAGTPCLIRSTLCHSSLHIDRKVFNYSEFINNYNIDIKQFKHLILYTTPNLLKMAEQIIYQWKKMGINVKIEALPYHKIISNPYPSNMVLIPIAGSTSPYTLASPDFPYCRWNYPNFFLKLSEGITSDRQKLISALEILDYTNPSTTVLFPKINVQTENDKLKLHIGGIGIPMLTSPIDDNTLLTFENSTTTPTTSSLTLTASQTSKMKFYFGLAIGIVIMFSLIALLFLTFINIKHHIVNLIKQFKHLIGNITISRKADNKVNIQGTQEEKIKNKHNKKGKFAFKIIITSVVSMAKLFINKVKKLLSKVNISSKITRKHNHVDDMLSKATETILSHIEKVGTKDGDFSDVDNNDIESSNNNTNHTHTSGKEKTEPELAEPITNGKDYTKPQTQQLKEIVEKLKSEDETSDKKQENTEGESKE